LNKRLFDLSTFSFSSFGWNDSIYTATYGIQQRFNTNINMITTDSLIVNVTGIIDTASGIVRWKFTSLNPQTLVLTNDPLKGFLPPDIHAPEGEGYVSYSVNLKPGDTTGTIVQNSASIIFDYNTAIGTNTYNNVVDDSPPVSAINPLSLANDTTINLSWSGTDVGSGIQYYDIYTAIDGGPFSIWLWHTGLTNEQFIANPGYTYYFFSLATDSAGNVETDTLPIRSILVSSIKPITSVEVREASLRNIPNPFRDETTIEFFLPASTSAKLTVYDVFGKKVAVIMESDLVAGQYAKVFSSKEIANGMYFLELKTDAGTCTSKMLIQK
jgi:hypothetical protein